ncbi:hypothetical protein [Arthrobacter sp. C9C5]|uniref:hypothetical protein n=1 Tax=Arthrobacter sp. C9C5 TaxID=2735267 RepID=UPI001584DA9A|nr:hypothetical protein [Arthrobacter sp. C9C5]
MSDEPTKGTPSMISALQWSTLFVCALVALFRTPSALRGENRSLFGVFALATFAVMLSIESNYTVIDAWLGSHNYANLLLRFVIYGTVLLAGYKIARGFGHPTTVPLLLGPVGLSVLAVIALATIVPFLMANTAGTSVGMAAIPDQSEDNRQLIRLYTAAGRLYPAYVAGCLLPATVGAMRSRLPGLVRSGAAVLSVGAAAMILLVFGELLPGPLVFLQYFISSTAVLGLVAGLALIWLGRVAARRGSRNYPSLADAHRAPGQENIAAEEL